VCAAGATVVLAVAVPASIRAAESTPVVVSLSAEQGHVVVGARFSPDEGPYQVEIARVKTMYSTGFVRRSTVVRERLPQTTTGVVRYRTHAKLAPGRYWVAVEANLLDATSCTPILRGASCNQVWSRPVAVRVR
jgi:hypothetical protein